MLRVDSAVTGLVGALNKNMSPLPITMATWGCEDSVKSDADAINQLTNPQQVRVQHTVGVTVVCNSDAHTGCIPNDLRYVYFDL